MAEGVFRREQRPQPQRRWVGTAPAAVAAASLIAQRAQHQRRRPRRHVRPQLVRAAFAGPRPTRSSLVVTPSTPRRRLEPVRRYPTQTNRAWIGTAIAAAPPASLPIQRILVPPRAGPKPQPVPPRRGWIGTITAAAPAASLPIQRPTWPTLKPAPRRAVANQRRDWIATKAPARALPIHRRQWPQTQPARRVTANQTRNWIGTAIVAVTASLPIRRRQWPPTPPPQPRPHLTTRHRYINTVPTVPPSEIGSIDAALATTSTDAALTATNTDMLNQATTIDGTEHTTANDSTAGILALID